MRITSEQIKEIAYDLVVVGGGMTGLCAAIEAARNGAKTALVHERPVLGGNASSEVRMHICGASASMVKPHLSESGIVHELMLANKRLNDSYNFRYGMQCCLMRQNAKRILLFISTQP